MSDRASNVPNWLFLLGDQAWPWALSQYDAGDATALAELLKSSAEIPVTVRASVAGIVDGSYPRDLRGRHRGKISPVDKEWATKSVNGIRRERDDLLADAARLEVLAEKNEMNVEDVVAKINRAYGIAVTTIAAQCHVSKRTLLDLMKPSKHDQHARKKRILRAK